MRAGLAVKSGELEIGVSFEELLGTVILKADRETAIVSFALDLDDRAEAKFRVANASAHQ